jgi:hypothetical protein
MAQLLRITFDKTDYSFKILNADPVSKETSELKILLNGETKTLIKDRHIWFPKESSDANIIGLAAAIGKTISLRYRI